MPLESQRPRAGIVAGSKNGLGELALWSILKCYFSSVASRTIRRAFWLLSTGLHLWTLNCAWMADWAFPILGSPENWALQRSQIPSTGMFLTRFTIRRLRLAIPKV